MANVPNIPVQTNKFIQYTLTLLDKYCRFSTIYYKIKNILINYAFRDITKNINIGELSAEELESIKAELENNNNDKDSIIIVPICQGCYRNIYQIGKNINLEEQEYVIL